jgi:hypothetical protein
MKKSITRLNQYAKNSNSMESYLCFKKFIEFLEAKVNDENQSRRQFYQIVLDRLHSFPELMEDMSLEESKQYDEILQLVAAIVLPLMDDDNEAMLGLSIGISSDVFYATNAFYRLDDSMAKHKTAEEVQAKAAMHKQLQYNLVLQKVYGYDLPNKKELVHGVTDPVTGLNKYYRVNIDTRFVDVRIKPGMEAMANQPLDACFECENPLTQVEKLLSLDYFICSGFSLVTLTDITEQEALAQIAKSLLNLNDSNADAVFFNIERQLETILGTTDYRFGIMPLFTINKRVALPYENYVYSILVQASFKAGIPRKTFAEYLDHFLKKPNWIIYEANSTEQVLPEQLANALAAEGINYYCLVPVFFNEVLSGFMEVGAVKDVGPINELQGAKLKPTVPFISQYIKFLIEKFNTAIDGIVKNNFTNIQDSVQWKFNEVAWHYFRKHHIEKKNVPIEKVFFSQVYPLYGAVDIRNSTIERNKVLREDLTFQLQLLINLLTSLIEYSDDDKLQELLKVCQDWVEKMNWYVSVEQELELNDFLYSSVHPLILKLDKLPAETELKVKNYFLAVQEEDGEAFKKRRQLENSMEMLNRVVGQYYDLFRDELQLNYPCYFEKFRTDGIEYDIYIGQSIAPNIEFSLQHLDKLRLWQVQSMAAITKLTHSLLPQLEHPLKTTQLIFVNTRPIDISFRNDERRFDVEGAYNIRYHIVKKRIDKVHIKDSGERLTQPGKIAIVYFNEKDVAGYIENIHTMQQEKILLNDLEYLELEPLQGVAGLRALRVGVSLDA